MNDDKIIHLIRLGSYLGMVYRNRDGFLPEEREQQIKRTLLEMHHCMNLILKTKKLDQDGTGE